MTKLNRWWTALITGQPSNPTPELSETDEHNMHPPTEDNEMTSTTTDERIARLRAHLDEVEIEAAADPLGAADNLSAWSARDQTRRDRRIHIETEIRQAQQFGGLLDNQGAMDAIRNCAAATAEARTKLRYIRENRRFKDNGPTGQVMSDIQKWWVEITKLATILPEDDPDATRHLAAEFDEWFAAREGLAAAYCLASNFGTDIPAPETTGPLPGGFHYGAHRAVQS